MLSANGALPRPAAAGGLTIRQQPRPGLARMPAQGGGMPAGARGRQQGVTRLAAVIGREETRSPAVVEADAGGGGEEVAVRAVVTVRKKLKETMTERMEEWIESILTGIGQGIRIQLVSQDIDPGS